MNTSLVFVSFPSFHSFSFLFYFFRFLPIHILVCHLSHFCPRLHYKVRLLLTNHSFFIFMFSSPSRSLYPSYTSLILLPLSRSLSPSFTSLFLFSVCTVYSVLWWLYYKKNQKQYSTVILKEFRFQAIWKCQCTLLKMLKAESFQMCKGAKALPGERALARFWCPVFMFLLFCAASTDM